MPKAGFKSITISEAVYEKFYDTYDQSKTDLAVKGVRSFSGYITYMLEEMMQKDKTFARYAPKLGNYQSMMTGSSLKTISKTE